MEKLAHCRIRGLANGWFQSFPEGRKQYTTIHGCPSSEKIVKYGVPQGSVLRPLLFILFINDLYQAVEFSSLHHFADDTNLLLIESSLKKSINISVGTVEWIRGNKFPLNASKTEIIVFKARNKTINKHLNFRIIGQKFEPSCQVRYLGAILQDDLYWNTNLTSLIKKLSCSSGLLSELRHYVPKHILWTIYYTIFNSHLINACEV